MEQTSYSDRPAHGEQDTVVLMSLYLILVAFFIMLNSMARLEESQIVEVLGSVKAKFRNELAIGKAGPTVTDFDGREKVISDFMVETRKIFADNLPIDHVDPVRRGDVLSFAVSGDDLFRPGAVVARPRSRVFLDAVAASLKRQRPGYLAVAEMVIGTGSALPAAAGAGKVFELRRATSLAHALRRRGVPARSIRTGMAAGDPGQISFIFKIQEEGQTRQFFASLAAKP